jgi:hypothetical protein
MVFDVTVVSMYAFYCTRGIDWLSCPTPCPSCNDRRPASGSRRGELDRQRHQTTGALTD